ncbi:hypothetical protein AYI75_10610 [Shewanella algae]|uniref:OmpA family protein n=1 Tax=Shewanella algae TaxID=38313 RepID=UPI0011A26287|nr:OmpA family protein [Shewanella algae]TWO84577.1 hypothetical protein AYI75_10610 [Shewanella algae]
MRASIFGGLLLGLPLSLSAAEQIQDISHNANYWYLGVDLGRGEFSKELDALAEPIEDSNLVGGVHLGYRFNPYLSAEMAYQYLGEIELPSGIANDKAKYQQLAFSALLGYPVTDDLYPYFKVGAGAWFGDSPHYSEGVSLLLGAGLSYAVTNRLNLRMEYQFTDSLGDALYTGTDHSMITLGISWRFGQSSLKRPAQAHSLAFIETPGKVEPTESVKQSIPSIYGISSLLLFGHDSVLLLQPETLDEVVDFMKSHPESQATLIGHADSVGSVDYNMHLSERRAEVAANYLIKRGIAAERVKFYGKGDSYPVTSNKAIEGRAMNRRVEIKVK